MNDRPKRLRVWPTGEFEVVDNVNFDVVTTRGGVHHVGGPVIEPWHLGKRGCAIIG